MVRTVVPTCATATATATAAATITATVTAAVAAAAGAATAAAAAATARCLAVALGKWFRGPRGHHNHGQSTASNQCGHCVDAQHDQGLAVFRHKVGSDGNHNHVDK